MLDFHKVCNSGTRDSFQQVIIYEYKNWAWKKCCKLERPIGGLAQSDAYQLPFIPKLGNLNEQEKNKTVVEGKANRTSGLI